MSGIVGRNADVAVSATDSGYTEIGRIKSASMSKATDAADCTTNDSAGNKEAEYADAQTSFSVSVTYEDADSGQDEVRTAAEAPTKLWVRYRPQALAGEREWRAQCLVTAHDHSSETGAVEEQTYTFESTGAVTYADQ